jgi:hypothetical protein
VDKWLRHQSHTTLTSNLRLFESFLYQCEAPVTQRFTACMIAAKTRQNVVSREEDKIKQNNQIYYFHFLFLIPTLSKNYLI